MKNDLKKRANLTLSRATQLALLYSTATVGAAAIAPAFAEEGVERIEVTGTAIKRTDYEGSLPVQVISKEDIARSGATSVVDLVQKLPSMQGFTTTADSVGGGGGGVATAALHGLDEEYTLVLLNGRRLAPATSGSEVNLNGIPLSAIERVEVLTDGASALYGSDAIAGVVNFILKDDIQSTTFDIRSDTPEEDGVGNGSWTASFVSGVGDLDRDGYNISVSYVHETREAVKSKDRGFAETGIISFQNNGQDLYFFNGSGNAIPGNARVRYLDQDGVEQTLTFNPYASATGGCASQNSAIGANCFFDYTSTLEILPEHTRDSVFMQSDFELTENLNAFSTVVFSSFEQTARIAPYPTGYVPVPTDSDIVKNEIYPHLTQEQIDNITSVAGRWRALPAGNRTTEYNTDTTHVVLGLEGQVKEMEYTTALTFSESNKDQNYPDGWLLLDEFSQAVSSGAINIFAHPSDFTDADKQALMGTIYHGNWDNETVSLNSFDAQASMPLFQLGGGDAYLAMGVDYREKGYDRSVSEANANEELLFLSKDTPYDLVRQSHGLFAELSMPFVDDLETNLSVRYDYIGAVENKKAFEGQAKGNINKSDSDVTYKLSVGYDVTQNLKLRAAVGTGFKAATMREIGEPLSDFGVTSDNYECPFAAGDELAQFCLTGVNQYNIYRKGNANLKPETSEQYVAGFVYAPSQSFSMAVDYWEVEMKDLVTRLEEATIFEQADRYRDLFTTRTNNATGEEELAIIQAAVNIGKSINKGVDWNFEFTKGLGFGSLKTALTGTVMLEAKETLPGSDNEFISSLGRFGENQKVTFRNIVKATSMLTHGNFNHTLALNFRTGYDDEKHTADDCAVTLVDAFGDCVEVQLRVDEYYTFDWQTQYAPNNDVTITAGVSNLFDEEPPLSLRTSGAGHQLGFDPRYTDALGRTIYASAKYTF